MKLYQQNEIPDGDTGLSWFDLHRIYSTCPAKWKFEEREDKASSAIAEHAAILNPEEFSRRFAREPAKEDFAECLSSDAEIQKWLKSRGIGGYSGKKYDELVEMVDKTGEKPVIYRRVLEKFSADNAKKQVVPAKDYDRTLQMRETLFANAEFARRIESSFNDILIVGEICGVLMHIKLDCIDANGNVIDYVGCTDASPEAFKMQAIRGGYYLKQALIHDMLSEIWDKPAAQQILAQERSYPNIPMLYDINQRHIEIGRIQYKKALTVYRECAEKSVWPNYSMGFGAIDLPIPDYYARSFGLDVEK